MKVVLAATNTVSALQGTQRRRILCYVYCDTVVMAVMKADGTFKDMEMDEILYLVLVLIYYYKILL